MSSEIECYGDPLLQLVTFHKGDAGWYYEGSFGAFETFDEAIEHAEESMFE